MGKPIYSEDFYLALEKDGGSIQLEKESLIAPVIQMKRESRYSSSDDDDEGPLITEEFLSPELPRALSQTRRLLYANHSLSTLSIDLLCAIPPDVFVGATRYSEDVADNKIKISVWRDTICLGTIEGLFLPQDSSLRSDGFGNPVDREGIPVLFGNPLSDRGATPVSALSITRRPRGFWAARGGGAPTRTSAAARASMASTNIVRLDGDGSRPDATAIQLLSAGNQEHRARRARNLIAMDADEDEARRSGGGQRMPGLVRMDADEEENRTTLGLNAGTHSLDVPVRALEERLEVRRTLRRSEQLRLEVEEEEARRALRRTNPVQGEEVEDEDKDDDEEIRSLESVREIRHLPLTIVSSAHQPHYASRVAPSGTTIINLSGHPLLPAAFHAPEE